MAVCIALVVLGFATTAEVKHNDVMSFSRRGRGFKEGPSIHLEPPRSRPVQPAPVSTLPSLAAVSSPLFLSSLPQPHQQHVCPHHRIQHEQGVQYEPLRLPGRAASFPRSISSSPQPVAAAAQLGSQQTHQDCSCACAAAAAEGRPGRAEGRGLKVHAGQEQKGPASRSPRPCWGLQALS